MAIGRQGQNVRLASKLLGLNIDVKGESKYAKTMEDGYQSLLAVDGVEDKLAERLYDAGLTSCVELAESSVEELLELELPEEVAKKIIVAAADVPAPEVEESAETEDEAAEEKAPAADDLQGKTNVELREMCAAAGITGVSKKKKDELVAVLEAAAADQE